jgi:lipid A 4'-phosphatase
MARVYWAGFAATAFLFLSWPAIDLWVSGFFHEPGRGFTLNRAPIPMAIHAAIEVIVLAGALAGLGLLFSRAHRRVGAFLLTTLAVGPGLLANLLLKDNWGRARPVHVVEFGGTQQFGPPLLPDDQCAQNCSFVGGDASAGFWLIAVALILPARFRAAGVFAGIAAGLFFGGNRVAQGAHFTSDILFAGFLVGGLVWFTHSIMMVPGGAARMIDRCLAAGVDSLGFLSARASTAGGRVTLAGLVVAPAAFIAMVAVDRPIARWVRDADPDFRALFAFVAHLGLGTGWLALGLAGWAGCRLAAALSLHVEDERRWRSRAWVGVFAFAACATAGLANNLIKVIAGRPRPKLFHQSELYGLHGWGWSADWQAMPSGHAAMIAAVATVAAILAPRHLAAYVLVASTVAVARVLSGAHWLSDVLVGLWIGVAAVTLTHYMFELAGVGPRAALAGAARWRSSPSPKP